MRIDIPTLYCLTIGTLCLAVSATLWERKAQPARAVPTALWAAGYAVLAVGCTIMLYRDSFPGVFGMGLTNVVMVAGYLTVLHGTARLDGPGRPRLLVIPVAIVAVVWAILGEAYAERLWHFGGSLPIALASGATAWLLWRSPSARGLRSRPIAIAVHAIHAAFYIARFAVLPLLTSAYGTNILVASSAITMFEAVLYSVAMPMAFLSLIREETQGQLLAASRTDYLTGLGNRHAFFDQGATLLERSDNVTLLAFDLDHFKTINDHHGHAAGDEVLKLFAQVARAGLGPNAVLARLGGEEFAALLPGIGAGEARSMAEALCRGFTREAARANGLSIVSTVSVGLAERQPDRADLTRLLSAADKALYSAKSLGRDRVEAAASAMSRAA